MYNIIFICTCIPNLAVVPIDTSICSKPLAYGLRSTHRGTERQWSRKLFNSKSKPRDRRMKATNCCLNSFMFAWKPAVISGKKTYLDQRKGLDPPGRIADSIWTRSMVSILFQVHNVEKTQTLVMVTNHWYTSPGISSNSLCSKSLGATNRPAEDVAFWTIPKQDLAPVRVFMG